MSNIVIAPVSTGRESNNNIAVIKTDHTSKGILSMVIPGALILKIVVMNFIAPIIEEAPAQCKLKIARSTDPPEWVWGPDKGGYTVHPVPAPCSTKEEANRRSKAGGNNQKLKLFNLGKAISGAPM